MYLYCITGFIGIILLGSIFHFVYDWSKQNKAVGFFVSVNESTWEHLKLAIFPIFIWAGIGLFFGFNNFAFGVFISLLTVSVLIPAIFYSYSYFSKRSILVVDILSFFVAVGVATFFACQIFKANVFPVIFNIIGIFGIMLFVVAFSLFTFFPPKNFLFCDPISKKYGFYK